MYKFVWLFLGFLLSACNLPLTNSNTPDLIATEVSNMLTNTPLQIESSESTRTPSPNKPVDTQPTINDSVVFSITPSITNTFTPSPTFTITASPTSANIPTGEPTWKDEFFSGTSFGINAEGYDDGNTIIFSQDDSLTLISVNKTGWRGWRLASHKPKNYYLKAIFITETCSGSDQYGIITQSPDYENGYGYYFGLTCDGRFSIQKWEENGLSNLEGWTESSQIKTGNTQTNSISILKSGENYKFFVNDFFVANVNDNHFSNPGFFGPFIAGLETPNFTVRLKEIAYWNLP